MLIGLLESGADALGFIFYPKSQRYIAPERAKEILQKIPGSIGRVGVFVNQEIQAVKEIVSFCGLHLIQLHGDESLQYCTQFPRSSLIKTVSRLRRRRGPRIGQLPRKGNPGGYTRTGPLWRNREEFRLDPGDEGQENSSPHPRREG